MTINYDSKGASLILINDGKALMMLRDDKKEISYPGCWAINGGHVDNDESFKAAAIRELKEETGYVSKNPHFFMSEIYVNDIDEIILAKRYFDIYDNDQEIKCLEGQKVEFLTADQIDKSKIFPGHGEAAKKAIILASMLDL